MLKNNIENDVKVKCMEEGITQEQLGYDIDIKYEKIGIDMR